MTAAHPILENDAIQEAIFEIRFERNEGLASAVFLGRLADNADWAGHRQAPLPLADVPESIRRVDPNFRHKPVLELASQDGRTAIRIGDDVLILSRRGEYPGWDNGFGEQVTKTASHLFKAYPTVEISRLGLRYVNALRSDLHHVRGAQDLQVALKAAEEEITDRFNLNFKTAKHTTQSAGLFSCAIFSRDSAKRKGTPDLPRDRQVI